MKNIKKVLAAISGGVMAFSAVSGITAGALNVQIDSPEALTAPNGYEEYEENYLEITYRNIEYPYSFVTYESFKYNYLSLCFKAGADWKNAYEKYAGELDMDKVVEYEGFNSKYEENVLFVQMYDLPVEGDNPRCPASIPDKQEIVKQFCSDLNNDGSLLDAEYTAFNAVQQNWKVEKWIEMDNFTGTAEEVQAVADKYTKYAEVTVSDDKCTVFVNDSSADSGDKLLYDDLMAMQNDVDALYADDTVSVVRSYDADNAVVSTAAINILSELQSEADIPYGDLNSDGKIGILDAIYISKANAQIITLNESQTKAADLNSDGTVDDADLNILLSYLVEQIDTLPVA